MTKKSLVMKAAVVGLLATACVGMADTSACAASTTTPKATMSSSSAPAPVPGAKASCPWGWAWQSDTCRSWSIPEGFAYKYVAVTTWGSGSQYCVIRPSMNENCDTFHDMDRFTTITSGQQQNIPVEPGDTIVQNRTGTFPNTYHLQVFGLISG